LRSDLLLRIFTLCRLRLAPHQPLPIIHPVSIFIVAVLAVGRVIKGIGQRAIGVVAKRVVGEQSA
jgi:hypothetical protein